MEHEEKRKDRLRGSLALSALLLLSPLFFLALLLGRKGLTAVIISLMALIFLSRLLEGRDEWRRKWWNR